MRPSLILKPACLPACKLSVNKQYNSKAHLHFDGRRPIHPREKLGWWGFWDDFSLGRHRPSLPEMIAHNSLFPKSGPSAGQFSFPPYCLREEGGARQQEAALNSTDSSLMGLCGRPRHPEVMITHVGGLDSAAQATFDMMKVPGGKRLVYTHVNMPMTAIEDFAEKGKADPFFAALDRICSANNGLWCKEAEDYLLANAPKVEIGEPKELVKERIIRL